MVFRSDEFDEIDDVDDSGAQLRQTPAEDFSGRDNLMVTMSPAQAKTMSGSLLGLSFPTPFPATCAACAVLNGSLHGEPLQCGCLSMTIKFTYDVERKQWLATDNRQSASGGM
jgi:hypothetical protein